MDDDTAAAAAAAAAAAPLIFCGPPAVEDGAEPMGEQQHAASEAPRPPRTRPAACRPGSLRPPVLLAVAVRARGVVLDGTACEPNAMKAGAGAGCCVSWTSELGGRLLPLVRGRGAS